MAAAEGPYAWRADLRYITPTGDFIAPSRNQAEHIQELIQGIANTTLFEEGLRTLSPELSPDITSDLRIEDNRILIKTGTDYTDILTLTNEQLQQAHPDEVAAIQNTANAILDILTRPPEIERPPVGAFHPPDPQPGPANAELLRIINEQAATIERLQAEIAVKDERIGNLQGRINTLRDFLELPAQYDPIEYARREIEGLRENNRAMANDLGDMITRNEELTTEQDRLREQLRLANIEIENRGRIVGRLSDENEALKHDLDASRHELGVTRDELERAQQTIRALRDSLSHAVDIQKIQEERLQLEEENAQRLKEQISTLEDIIRSKETTIRQLNDQLEAERKAKNELIAKNATLQEQFDRITDLAIKQRKELSDILSLLPDYAGDPLKRVQSLKEAYIAAIGDASHAKEKLRQAEERLAPIEKAIREKKEALEKMRISEKKRLETEQQYNELCARYSQDSQSFLATNDSLRETVQRLQEELDRTIEERDLARAQLTPSPSSSTGSDEESF